MLFRSKDRSENLTSGTPAAKLDSSFQNSQTIVSNTAKKTLPSSTPAAKNDSSFQNSQNLPRNIVGKTLTLPNRSTTVSSPIAISYHDEAQNFQHQKTPLSPKLPQVTDPEQNSKDDYNSQKIQERPEINLKNKKAPNKTLLHLSAEPQPHPRRSQRMRTATEPYDSYTIAAKPYDLPQPPVYEQPTTIPANTPSTSAPLNITTSTDVSSTSSGKSDESWHPGLFKKRKIKRLQRAKNKRPKSPFLAQTPRRRKRHSHHTQ